MSSKIDFGNRTFTSSYLARSRRTIVDLLRIVGQDASAGYIFCELDMTYAKALMKSLSGRGQKTTVTALLLKAIAVAQQSCLESRTEALPLGLQVTYHDIVAGFTVERMVDGQATVFLGEIIDPHKKSVQQISKELRSYGQSTVKSLPPLRMQQIFSRLPAILRSLVLILGKSFPYLRLKCQKATFGLSSLGKLGISSLLSPCLCSSIFGVGTLEERVQVLDSAIVIRPTMTITLNFDLRVFDYSAASRFVGNVKSLVEGGLDLWLNEESLVSGHRIKYRQYPSSETLVSNHR